MSENQAREFWKKFGGFLDLVNECRVWTLSETPESGITVVLDEICNYRGDLTGANICTIESIFEELDNLVSSIKQESTKIKERL